MNEITVKIQWSEWVVEEEKQDGPWRMDGQPLGREKHLTEAVHRGSLNTRGPRRMAGCRGMVLAPVCCLVTGYPVRGCGDIKAKAKSISVVPWGACKRSVKTSGHPWLFDLLAVLLGGSL